MIDAERLQDAITLLPEELLAPVDALRKRKRISWKPITAVAASFLLIVGLWWLQPGQKTTDTDSFLEDAAGRGESFVEEDAGSYIEHSTTLNFYSLPAKITEITEVYLVVTLPAGESGKVFLDNLENPPIFSIGEEITLFFKKMPVKLTELYPDEILKVIRRNE